MFPYLFSFPFNGHPVHVPTYGVLLALAFSTGYFLSLRRAKKLGEDPIHVENLFLLVVFGAVVGSRLFHVVFEEPAYYREHPEKIVAIWEGGYTFYGALLTCITAIFLYCRKTKINFLNYADICAPSTALGLAIGRIGCFSAGCCWGKPTDWFLGVTFNHPDSFAGVKGIPVHPTQLYESFAAFCIFLYLRWRFNHRQYIGQLLFEGLMIYSVARPLVEFFRGDDYRGVYMKGWLSTSQIISLGIFVTVLVAMRWYRPRAQSALNGAPAGTRKSRAARR